MKVKLLGILSLMLLVLASSVFAIGNFKIQQPLGTDIFVVGSNSVVHVIKLNVTTILNATGATLDFDADSVTEANINFITTCATGYRLYIDAGNLACEVAGNTTEQIQDLAGAMFQTKNGIIATYDDTAGKINLTLNVTSKDILNESFVNFTTPCAAGNHLYVGGGDLLCEADDDTTYDNGTGITLTGTTFSLPDSCGDNEILKYNTTHWNCTADISGSGLANVVEDTTPALGGSLDVGAFAIDSGDGTTNMTIDSNGNFIIVLV